MLIRFRNIDPQIADGVFIAPNSAIIGDVVLGEQSSVWFGASIRGDYGPIRIGSGCSIQDNVVIHVNHNSKGEIFPTTIGNNCIVGHGAVVEGCDVGDGCLIGMNAVILPRATIGAGSIVAAGAVVKSGQSIPPNSLVAGTPAVIKRTLPATDPEIAWSAEEYKALAAEYLAQSGDDGT